MRILLRSIIISLAAAGFPCSALAQENSIPYVVKSLSETATREMWKDLAPTARNVGSYAPWAMVATIRVSSGDPITVTQLNAGGICGSYTCPVRVFQGGKMLTEVVGCDSDSEHKVAADGRILDLCGQIVPTKRR